MLFLPKVFAERWYLIMNIARIFESGNIHDC